MIEVSFLSILGTNTFPRYLAFSKATPECGKTEADAYIREKSDEQVENLNQVRARGGMDNGDRQQNFGERFLVKIEAEGVFFFKSGQANGIR